MSAGLTLGQPGLKPNDGPAFPCSHGDYMQFGMSLRDYFAARAPISVQDAMIASGLGMAAFAGRNRGERIEIMKALAEMRMDYADAMLAERAKP